MTGWLLFSLEKQIAKSVWYYKKARDIWHDLEERYGQASGTQLFSLQQQISEMQQGKMFVSSFFSAIKALWD